MPETRHRKLLWLVGALALLGGLALLVSTREPNAPVAAAEEPAAAVASQEPTAAIEEPAEATEEPAEATAGDSRDTGYWLLEEFDWGDDEEVVEESLLFDPAYQCRGTSTDRCRLVKVVVDGEELLARFHHHEGGLWQAAFITPDLETFYANRHLGRVRDGLVAYITRFIGEPIQALDFPELESLELGPPLSTHLWQKDGLEVRISVGRRDEDLFYVGAFFFDPSQDEAARPAWEADIAESEARNRKKRAGKASRTIARKAMMEAREKARAEEDAR